MRVALLQVSVTRWTWTGGPVSAAAAASDKEVVLISLRRPLVYVQPMAVDKAILVWLNYRNAYDYWSEQRRTLNREVLTATQQVGWRGSDKTGQTAG